MKTFITKNGDLVVIRMAMESDAKDILATSMQNFKDSEYLLTTPEEFTLTEEQEKAYLRAQIASENSAFFVAAVNGKIVGVLNLTGHKRRRMAHIAVLGLGILKEWRHQHIGQAIMVTALEWAVENPVLETITLEVIAANEPAIALYKKMGFKEYGRLPNAIKYETGKYAENILLYTDVKRVD